MTSGAKPCPVLDDVVDQGLCEPVIVVTPTYYSRVEGCPLGSEQVEELARRLNDRYISGQGKGDDREQNIWPQYFGQELRNNIESGRWRANSAPTPAVTPARKA